MGNLTEIKNLVSCILYLEIIFLTFVKISLGIYPLFPKYTEKKIFVLQL